MTEPSMSSRFGITVEHVGEEIALQIGDVTYEGTLTEVHDSDVVLTDYLRSAPGQEHQSVVIAEPVTVTLTHGTQVWLGVDEDDFITDETGAVTLPGGPTTLDN